MGYGQQEASDPRGSVPRRTTLEWDGWRLTLENAGVANFYDRRQWGSNRSATITLHAGERVNYGAPVPDAAPCTWKWRFEKQTK